MAPAFSKLAVLATTGIPLITGLRCGHGDCYALFLTLEDSEEHALRAHSGNEVVLTCNIYERKLGSGEVRLYRVVLDEDEQSVMGSEDGSANQSSALPTPVEASPPSQSDTLSFTPSQALSRKSTESAIDIPSSLGSSSLFTPGSQALSRRSTEPAIDIPSSSFSSFSSSSSSLPLSSFGDNEHQKLSRILAAVQDVVDRCRICWVRREQRRPHLTFKCPTKICSSNDWQTFKTSLQFPKNTVCYFCLCPYAPPFNHERAPPGTQPSPGELCEYPDVLRELAYILYQDQSLRKQIFTKLGVAPPSSLYLYKRFIAKRREGNFWAYEVINAYLELRESGELAA